MAHLKTLIAILSSAALFACSDENLINTELLNDNSVSRATAQDELYYYYQGEKTYIQANTNSYYISRKSDEYKSYKITTYSTKTDIAHAYSVDVTNEKNNDVAPNYYFEKVNSSFDKYSSNNLNKEINSDIEYISLSYNDQRNSDFFISPYLYVKVKNIGDTILLKDLILDKNCEFMGEIPMMKQWYVIRALSNNTLEALQIANMLYETGKFIYSTPDFGGLEYKTNGEMENDKVTRAILNGYYDDQWGLENTGQYSGTRGIDIRWSPGSALISTPGLVRVGLIDSGVDYSHNGIKHSAMSYDPNTNQTFHGMSMIYRNEAHGTCCAGIIAGIGKVAGVAGNDGCEIVSISIDMHESNAKMSYQVASGISWALQNGIDIINCSWYCIQNDIVKDAIVDAIENGRNGLGCIVVAASGNNDTSSVSFPANIEGVIAVGAIDMTGKRREKTKISYVSDDWGSNYGEKLDLVAPGVNITTTDITGTSGANGVNDYDDRDYTKYFAGTSAAAPFVCGAVAMILQKKPLLTYEEVTNYILKNCIKLPAYTYANKPAHPISTWNEETGYGLLDLYGTLSDVLQIKSSLYLEGPETVSNRYSTFVVRGVPSGGYVEWSVTDKFRVSRTGYNSAYVWATESGLTGGVTAIVKLADGSVVKNLSQRIFSLY